MPFERRTPVPSRVATTSRRNGGSTSLPSISLWKVAAKKGLTGAQSLAIISIQASLANIANAVAGAEMARLYYAQNRLTTLGGDSPIGLKLGDVAPAHLPKLASAGTGK